MTRLRDFFRSLHGTLRDIGLYRLIGFVLTLVVLGALGLWISEPSVENIGSAFWWSIVTLTTVGYGDISPATTGGRIVGAFIMIMGIGVLGAFTSQLASLLTERRRLKDQGLLVDTNLTDHLILSGWSPRAKAVLDTIRSDARGRERPVVLIAERDEAPVYDDALTFIQGKTNEDTLEKANLSEAETVIIFGDPALEEEARDAKVVLHLLTVESLHSEVHTIVEVEMRASIAHCRRAHADEVIVGSEFTSHLMSRASLDHNISNVLSEMMDPRTGVEIFKVPLDGDLVDETFGAVMQRVKEEHDCLVIGVEERADGREDGSGGVRVLANPPRDRRMQNGETLIVIGNEEMHRLEISAA
jgi:voltage-gated potassium channel